MVDFKVALSILVAVAIWASDVEGACPAEYTLVGGRCVKVIGDQMTWDAASAQCQQNGGYLAIVDNGDYLSGLAAHLADVPGCQTWGGEKSFWLSGRRKKGVTFNWRIFNASKFLDDICVYRSVTEMNNWAPGEPNDANGEDCIEMRHYSSKNKYMFNDLGCTKKNCALCEHDG